MRRLLRATLWTVGLLLAVGALGLGGGTLWLRGSLPDLAGNHDIGGLGAPVEVLRDDDGLVTIRAENELDAYRALGYVHAQDRLWQMDFMRRTGAGRLSEVIGPETLRFDRLLRGLGLYRVAEANLEHLSAEARAVLDAYAEGVNAFLDAPGGPWPPVFQLLRYEPEPWRPADSLVWGRLMSLQLSNNMSAEMRRLRLAGRLSPAQIDSLFPPYPEDGPVSLSRLSGPGGGPDPATDLLPWDWAPKDASNFWVLSGENTTTGKPILANDPHLAHSAPGFWYLVRIETPELTLVGATTPGVPFLILGHNGRIAWGFTTTHGDTQDLFVERLSDGKPGHYDTPDGPRPFETREEVIRVKDQEPVRLTVRSSRHGPVLSDLRKELAAFLPANQVLALAWPALRADDRSAEAIYRLNRAGGWQDFLAAMELFQTPLQNVAYADSEGRIGFLAAGRIPVRKAGDGRWPVPGWTGEFDWTGFIPFEALPQRVDPAAGRIVNANNPIVGADYAYLIAADWPDPHRARRIEQMFAEGQLATVEGNMAAQQDNLSLGAARLLPLLLAVPPQGEQAARAHGMLSAWDLRMARERPEPLIFYAWVESLTERILGDELGPVLSEFQRGDLDLLAEILSNDPTWCEDVLTPEVETCDAQVSAALRKALSRLEKGFGGAMEEWRWGAAHVARFPHAVLRHIPVLNRVFSFAVEADGGSYTVNRGGVRFRGPRADRFEDIHGPGYRAVYDLSDLDNSRFMIATGQSGNPLSPFYGSLAERWRDGDYLKLVGERTAKAKRLVLNPR